VRSYPPTTKLNDRWGAGFLSRGLGLKEDAVSLEPWRLAIAGDFIRAPAAAPAAAQAAGEGGGGDGGGGGEGGGGPGTPAEAAALSGLEAAERVAGFFAK
jgi:hypothetical protein